MHPKRISTLWKAILLLTCLSLLAACGGPDSSSQSGAASQPVKLILGAYTTPRWVA